MAAYPYDEYTRVVVAAFVANMVNPTWSEITSGVDITCDLTKDGLNLPKSTEAISRARWHSTFLAEDPGRYGYDSPSLKGRRYVQGSQVERLWVAAVYQTGAFLIIRRGIPYATPWADNQNIEVLQFRWGKRYVVPSAANTQVTFVVPLFISQDIDFGHVVGTPVTPTGEPILEETGDYLLEETGEIMLEEVP